MRIPARAVTDSHGHISLGEGLFLDQLRVESVAEKEPEPIWLVRIQMATKNITLDDLQYHRYYSLLANRIILDGICPGALVSYGRKGHVVAIELVDQKVRSHYRARGQKVFRA